MIEDNYIDQEMKEMLEVLTEHGRNLRRQQQLSAMIDRSTAMKRRHYWLGAIVVVVMLSVAVALSLNSDKNKSKSMMQTVEESNWEISQVAEEPMVLLPEDEIVTDGETVVETQDMVDLYSNPVKPSIFAESVKIKKYQPSFEEPLSIEPTYPSEIIENEDLAIAAGTVENPSAEPFENQNIEPVSNEINHTVTKKEADSLAPIIKRETPYRPKNKFTIRVGGEIDPNGYANLPFPPVYPHFALGLMLDYHFTEYFSMGLGADWFNASIIHSIYQDSLRAIPVFVDLKLNVWGKKNYSPFMEARLGYSIPLNVSTQHYSAHGVIESIMSGPYLSLGLGCSMKHSNLSAGVVCSQIKDKVEHYYDNSLRWGKYFFIRYDYNFSHFSEEGKRFIKEGRRRIKQVNNGSFMNEFDGFQIQVNVAGGVKPWCYSVGAALEYKFPKYFSIGVGADFRGIHCNEYYDGRFVKGHLFSMPVYGDLKVHFLENKLLSPFVEYCMGYAFALNKLAAVENNPYYQYPDCIEMSHQGLYAYLGIGVTYKHSSLSFGVLQDGYYKTTIGLPSSETYNYDHLSRQFELRYSYKIGPLTKRHWTMK